MFFAALGLAFDHVEQDESLFDTGYSVVVGKPWSSNMQAENLGMRLP